MEIISKTYLSLYIRKELNIDNDTLVIGHIGRFYEQKNHEFLIEIARQLRSKNIKFKMLLVGKGQLKDKIETLVKENNLFHEVIFLGVRSDIPALLKVFDVFVFPSFYEGLPVTLIETQAAGVKSIVSDTITDEVDIVSNNMIRLSLKEPVETWVKRIIENQNIDFNIREVCSSFNKNGYNALENIKMIYELYNLE